MQTDWLLGLAGGFIIGLAAAMYLLINGRVMGASGILGGLLDGSGRSTAVERLFFIAALIAVPGLLALLTNARQTHLTGNLVVVVVGGLLVGLGTRLAGGCTSGHGVCGISRLSLRGVVATVFYIFGGAVAVLLFRHLWEIV